MRFVSYQRQIVVSMLDTKLRGSTTLTVYHLWVISSSLCLNLLTRILCKYTLVSVTGHLIHICVNKWALVMVRQLFWFILLSIRLSGCHYCLFGIWRTDIVFLVSLCGSDPIIIIPNLILVLHLNHLLLLIQGSDIGLAWIIRVNLRVMQSSCLVKRYLNTSCWVSYVIKIEMNNKYTLLLTGSLLNPIVNIGVSFLVSISGSDENLFWVLSTLVLDETIITLVLGNDPTGMLHLALASR